MQKFLVLYMMPQRGMQDWMQKPEEERKPVEEKMKADWDAWAKEHASALKETAGAGKTKRVNPNGIADVGNEIMLYSIVEAESADAAAEMFKNHPHLGIPESWIDVMPANNVPGMGS